VNEQPEQRLFRIRKRADSWCMVALVIHSVMASFFAMANGDWPIAIITVFSCLALTWAAQCLFPASAISGAVGGVALMAFCALHIFQFQGLPEMHFFFFITLFILLAYHDHRVFYWGVGLIIAQHLMFALEPNSRASQTFWGVEEVTVVKLALHFGLALIATTLAAFFSETLRSRTLQDAKLAAHLAQKTAELQKVKQQLEQDVRRRIALEDVLNHSLATMQQVNAALEFENGSLAVELTRLESLADSDPLTGLPNLRFMQQKLNEMLLQEAPMSIVMLDLDHFKHHNDTYGHPHGDEVLRQVAGLLKSEASEGVVVGRYGGEEFLVALSGLDVEESYKWAERFRHKLADHPWPVAPVTASLGVSTRLDEWRDLGELIHSADEALYQSKAHGRNRVTHADMRRRAA